MSDNAKKYNRVNISVDGSDYISLEAARNLIPSRGKRAPRERLLSLGLAGKIKVRQFGSRWWVSRRSIEAYLAREASSEARLS